MLSSSLNLSNFALVSWALPGRKLIARPGVVYSDRDWFARAIPTITALIVEEPRYIINATMIKFRVV